MKKIMTALTVLCLVACTDPNNATRVLEDQGYSDVHITGYRYFGCSQHDNVHTGFTAKGPTGRPISGIVCSGASIFGKNNTIRLD